MKPVELVQDIKDVPSENISTMCFISSKQLPEDDFSGTYYKAEDVKELASAWNEYKKYLQEKYPPQDGEEWKFTCEHHQKIDSLIQKFES